MWCIISLFNISVFFQDDNLGNYTCQAGNRLGKAQTKFIVRQHPTSLPFLWNVIVMYLIQLSLHPPDNQLPQLHVLPGHHNDHLYHLDTTMITCQYDHLPPLDLPPVSGGEQLGGELWAGKLWLQLCLLPLGLPPLYPPPSHCTQLGTVTVPLTVLMQVPGMFVPEQMTVSWMYVPDKAPFQHVRKGSWTRVTLQQLQVPVQQTISLTSQKEQMMNNSVVATNASASVSPLQCWGGTLWKLPTNQQDG